MTENTSLLRQLQDWYTRLIVPRTFGTIEEIESRSINGETHRIYWCDANSSTRGGHTTMLNTILVNTKVREEIPDLQDYVVMHEAGHASLPLWIRIPLSFAFLILLLPLIIIPFAFLLAVFLIASGRSIPLWVLQNQIVAIGITAALTTGISWTNETIADLYAIRNLGKSPFEEYWYTKSTVSQLTRREKAFFYFIYPPRKLVLLIAEWRDYT